MKNSIYGKIRGQVLLGSVIAAAAVCLAAVLCIVIMRGNLIGTSERLGTSAADDSKDALEHQMRESLLRLALSKANVSDEKLKAVSGMVSVIAYNATKMVAAPDRFLAYPILFPEAAFAGFTVAQLRLPEDVEREAVEDEIGLLGHLSPLLIAQYDALDYVGSVYLGSERGVSISADGDSHLKTNIYDPRTRSWYKAAADAGELTWTDVFADNSGRGLAITCAMPFYGADGELFGVIGAGMLLEVLKEIVVETSLGETGYAFIANERGELIISDMMTIDDDGNILSENLNNLLPPETAGSITNGQSGIARVQIDGGDCFIAYAPLETLPWSLAVVMSVEEVVAPATLSERHIIDMTTEAVKGIDRIIIFALLVFALALLLTLLGNAVLARRMAAGLAKPIIELSDGAGIIGAGDLDYRLLVRTGDEIEALADTFNAMIANIKAITAEKERIGAELNVATQIQASMLPCIFPAFPERKEFDIYASMQPAKEVGGDFYDFFLMNDNTLAVVMADVSGKGVPAALFMVIAKTLIKNNAQSGKSPKEVFEAVNNILCENNEAGMFVTAFMGFLDIPSGTFTYVNAGHNFPLLGRAKSGYQFLKNKPAFILAGMEDMRYPEYEITLAPGDIIYLYTDGVTEAMNSEKELFSDPRLLEIANQNTSCSVKELIAQIKKEIDLFAEGAEQADDITMLALEIGKYEE